MEKSINHEIRERTPALVGTAYRKLLIPDISARLCNVAVTLVDSLIAARFIGLNAMSAIALLTPLFLFINCMHCLFGSGTTPVLIRYKSRGEGKEAKRAFGAILLCGFAGYVVICAALWCLLRPILGLFTEDARLIDDAILYYLPMLITQPLAETGLIFERGMKTDGRPGFFSLRSVITNVLNIILSILAVTVFNGGILGISLASCLSSLLGYCWSASHFFTKGCTIHPDFSVIKAPKEMKQYVKEEMTIGCVNALDSVLNTGVAALTNKAFIMTGGTAGLAAIGICSSVFNIAGAVSIAVGNVATDLGNLFFADKDYTGTKYVIRKGVIVIAGYSAALLLLFCLFPGGVARAYGVTDPQVYEALLICLRILLFRFACDWFTNLFGICMIIFGRTKTAGKLTLAANAVFALSTLPAFLGSDFFGLMVSVALGAFLIAALEGILVFMESRTFDNRKIGEVRTFSYSISEAAMDEISRKILELLPERIAGKASLLTEECNKLILFVNRDRKKPVLADIRVNCDEKECVITMVDNGRIFDPLHSLTEGKLAEEYVISRQILKGFSPKAGYSRVVDLNISHLVIGLEQQGYPSTAGTAAAGKQDCM